MLTRARRRWHTRPALPAVHLDETLPWAVTWTVDEPMERSSHALVADGRVWLLDPVADEAALDAAEALGEVTAVLQLLDRHPRDCATLAARYGVPHYLLPQRVPDSPFEVRRMVWLPGWREVSLWWSDQRALVVAEAVGTASYFAVAGRRLGMHPMLRALPPGALRLFAPRVLLCGHGRALHEDAASALDEALSRSRRDVPRAALAAVRAFSGGQGPSG